MANPAASISTSANRTWTDANGDYLPQESELGPLSNTRFGQSVVTTRYDDETRAERGYNWALSTSLQHELAPRVSANVGYFRRWHGNFRVTDNLAVGPSRFRSLLRVNAN